MRFGRRCARDVLRGENPARQCVGGFSGRRGRSAHDVGTEDAALYYVRACELPCAALPPVRMSFCTDPTHGDRCQPFHWDIRDLPDERRAIKAAKLGVAESDRDVTEGRVTLREFSYKPVVGMIDNEPVRKRYPACVVHGAMQALTKTIWRCGECGVGCEFHGYVQQRSPYAAK